MASYRMNSFAKYLDRSKYQVTVVSLEHTGRATENIEFDDVNVYREPYNSFFRIRQQKRGDAKLKHKLYALNNKLISRFFTEDYPGWSESVVLRLKKIHKAQSIDLLISSYAPVDAHLAAFAFRKEYSNVKWIADMRDEMSQNPFLSVRSKSRLYDLEKKISEYIDALTTVSAPILEGFKTIMSNDRILFQEIRNGFDHELQPVGNFNPEFTFLYAGTFYGKRKPDTLFAAISELLAEGHLKDFKIELAGTHRNFSVPKELESHLEFLPHLTNAEAVERMMLADSNLLIHPPMGVKGVYTGKLFEYLSTGKPVLALVDTEDVAADLIREVNGGEVVDFYDRDAIKSAILTIYQNWEKQTLPKMKWDIIRQLHRRKQVELLEEVINKLTK